MKLDGIQRDYNTGRKTEEEFFGIRLGYNKITHRIVIDVNITSFILYKM